MCNIEGYQDWYHRLLHKFMRLQCVFIEQLGESRYEFMKSSIRKVFMGLILKRLKTGKWNFVDTPFYTMFQV